MDGVKTWYVTCHPSQRELALRYVHQSSAEIPEGDELEVVTLDTCPLDMLYVTDRPLAELNRPLPSIA